MLTGADDQLPPRWAAMARFAVALTDVPWSFGREHVAELSGHDLDADAVEAAIGVVGVFNYLTRVANASGIDFDYHSPLPAFEPDHERPATARPDRDQWPVIDGELRTFTRYPILRQAWRQWHGYVFESDEPLGHRERQLLARAAAEEACDRWRADELDGYEPKDDAEATLVRFGRQLAREPWRMRPADLEGLRAAGYPEPALLHAIAVVALQSAESRVAMGLAALASLTS